MMNILLFIHAVVALLLITVILLQKTSSDSLGSISGGNNMGIMKSATAANFLTKTTIVLAAIFMINSIVLANLSSQTHKTITNKIENIDNPKKEKTEVPIAK